NTNPITEKTMIFRRFLFFGFAISSLSKTRDVPDLFQTVGPCGDKSCPSEPNGRLQVRSKIVNPAYLPHPGRTIAATNTAQTPNSQIAALPKAARQSFASPSDNKAIYQNINTFNCARKP